jgi:hypothetical protein
MITFFSFVPLGFLFAVTAFPFPSAQGEKYQGSQLEGLTITMTLEKRSPTVQKIDWPVESIVLSSQSVPTKEKTIHELLRENNIFPDVEAFNVVYGLNPEIQKLSDLKVHQIRIPVVRAGQKLEAAFAGGFMVFLTIDKESKERFNENVMGFTKLGQAVSGFSAEKFPDPTAKESITTSLNTISVALNGINKRLVQRFGRPIPTEALDQLNADTELLNGILSAKTSTGAPISKAEQAQIAAIEKDIRVKSRAYSEVAAGEAPARWPEVKVIVKTLRQGQEIPSLRIYYVPEAHKNRADKARSFGVLSSPSNQKLPEADYCFWAARDPDKTAVTNQQCLEVRTDRDAEIQLTVIR